MGDKNICNEIPPVYILLPMCTEANVDVFLNIVRNALARQNAVARKNAVARSKMDSLLDNAFRTGMAGDILNIHAKDTSLKWKNLQKESQQIRQAKLLGYWAIHYYPSLGKKLIGESYTAPERKSVMIIDKEHSSLMNADEVDAFILRKMKLRIIELKVSQSTWDKLKHFVKAPVSVVKYNELKLTPKMTSYDIDKDYIDNCWKAVKFGTFPTDEPINHSLNKPPVNENFEQPLGVSTELMLSPPNSSVAAFREMEEHTISGNGPQLPKLTCLKCSTSSVEITADPTDSFGDSTNDSCRMILMEIREKICNLTKWCDPTTAGHHNDVNGPERLHVMIMKEKDVEITRMKVFTEELQKENESLKNEKLINNYKQTIAQHENINTETALKKQIEELEEDLIKWNTDAANKEITYVKKFEEVIRIKELICADKEKLEDEFNDLKKDVASTVSLKNEIEKLDNNLNEMTAKNEKLEEEQNEMANKNRELEEDLIKWKELATKKGKELEEVIIMKELNYADKEKLEDEFNDLKKDVASTVSLKNEIEKLNKNLNEMTAKNEKLEEEQNEMANKNRELEEDLIKWKELATKKGEELEEVIIMKDLNCADKEKLEDEINDLKKDVASTVSLKNEIEKLDNNLNEMTAKNEKLEEEQNEMANKNRELEEDLIKWKELATKKGKELEEVIIMKELNYADKEKLEDEFNDLKKDVASTVSLKNEIEKLNKNLNEMTAKNEKLEEEQNEMANKNRELEEDLIKWKELATKKGEELEEVIIMKDLNCADKEKLEDEINDLKKDVASTVSLKNEIEKLDNNLNEMTAKNEKLEEEQNEMANKNRELEEDLIKWKELATKKGEELEEVIIMKELDCANKEKLEGQLNDLKKKVSSTVLELKSEIEELDKNLNEMTVKNQKLEEELINNSNRNESKISLFTTALRHRKITHPKVVGSDNTKHTKETLVAYLYVILSKLSSTVEVLKIWSDGPYHQFKNKFITAMIAVFEKIFNIKIIWNFFATVHGKYCIDGIGAAVKHTVKTLVLSEEVIVNNTNDFVSVFKLGESRVDVIELTVTEIEQINFDLQLNDVFSKAPTIRAISKLHQIQFEDNCVKGYTLSKDGYDNVNV